MRKVFAVFGIGVCAVAAVAWAAGDKAEGVVSESVAAAEDSENRASDLKKRCEELSTSEKPYYYGEGELSFISGLSSLPADPPPGVIISRDPSSTFSVLSIRFLLEDGEERQFSMSGSSTELENLHLELSVNSRYGICYSDYLFNKRKKYRIQSKKHILRLN